MVQSNHSYKEKQTHKCLKDRRGGNLKNVRETLSIPSWRRVSIFLGVAVDNFPSFLARAMSWMPPRDASSRAAPPDPKAAIIKTAGALKPREG